MTEWQGREDSNHEGCQQQKGGEGGSHRGDVRPWGDFYDEKDLMSMIKC